MMDIRELKRRIEGVRPPIIELAGPTPEGYELLRQHVIRLPIAPIVTNISREVTINPFGDSPEHYTVDGIADVKGLPYADASVGMFLVSCLPMNDTAASDPQYESVLQATEQEYTAVLAGRMDAINHALHLHMYAEVSRSLIPGGLLLQVEATHDDLQAAERFGLAAAYTEQGEYGFTAVFLKAS